jgi:hypothetical protein
MPIESALVVAAIIRVQQPGSVLVWADIQPWTPRIPAE